MSAEHRTGQEPPQVHLFGASHRTAPLEVLERLSLQPDEIRAFYQHISSGATDVTDVLVLSTCNRTEIYSIAAAGTDPGRSIQEVLRQVTGNERFPSPEYLYDPDGIDSVQHLFRVACGLDSMVLGETQILGQVKDAYDTARRHVTPSPYFERIMQSAFKVAKRSRSDTEIGKGAVSVASAGVHLATRIYGDMSRRSILVVGAGQTGRLVAEHFAKHNPGRLTILNRTPERAEVLAREVNAIVRPLADLANVIPGVDIVATAVGSPTPIIDRQLIEPIMRDRSGRTLALIDLGLPRNVAIDVDEIANVFLHDIESLKQVVDANLARRRREIPHVEQIITGEIDKLLNWQQSTQVGPLIAALRHGVEGIRQSEVKRVSQGLSPKEVEAIERATRAVVNKILHGPMTSIKEFARQQEAGAERLELIRQVFGNLRLDEDGED